MEEGRAYDASHVKVSLMTDEELYEVYLKAEGFPKKKYGHAILQRFEKSRSRRFLTIVDACIYFFLFMLSGLDYGLCLAAVPFMLSIFNISAGPCSLLGLAYYHRLAAEFQEPPSRESVQLHSPENLLIIAQYLTKPLSDTANTILMRLDGERVAITRLLLQAEKVRDDLRSKLANLSEPALETAFRDRLEEAAHLAGRLKQQMAALDQQVQRVHEEIRPVQKHVEELESLANAGKQLRHLHRVLHEPEDGDRSGALVQFAGLRARLELAQDNLQDVATSLEARKLAEEEIGNL